MSEIRTIADGLRGLAKQYKAVLAAGEFLDEIANIENLKAEAEQAAEKAKARRDAALTELGAVEGRVAAAEAKLAGLAAEESTVVQARQDAAAAVVKAAEEKAAALIGKATAEAQAQVARGKELEAEARRLDGVIAGKKAELATLVAQVDAVKVSAARIAGA